MGTVPDYLRGSRPSCAGHHGRGGRGEGISGYASLSLRGSDNPRGRKVPIRPGRGEVIGGAGARGAEPVRSPPPPAPTSSPAGQLGSLQGARLPGAVTAPRAGPPWRPLQAAVSSATCGAWAAELPPGDRKPVTAPAYRGHLPAPIAAPTPALASAPLSLVFHAQTRC